MLIEIIAKTAGKEQERRAYYPSPSKAGKCIRALVYHATGIEPDPFSDRTILVFEDGHWHEELIKDHIRKMDRFELVDFKGKNQRIRIADINGAEMNGEIDGLILDKDTDNLYLLEIKSINHFGFEALEDAPQKDHIKQANLYLHGLIYAGFNVQGALFIYKNKNTAAMKEFIIPYREDLALADIQTFREIDLLAAGKTLPPRPYQLNDWQCGYCGWAKTCWKGYAKEVETLSEDASLNEEAEVAARYHKELGGQAAESEKQRKVTRETLLQIMTQAGAKTARAGEYLIEREVSVTEKWDKKLIPEWIKKRIPKKAIKIVPSEKLTVTRLKNT